MISRKIAREHPDAQGQPQEGRRHAADRRQAVQDRRPLRDRLDAPGRRHRHGHRRRRGPCSIEPKDSISCIYVEADDPADNDALAAAIEKAHPGFDARSMNEAQANFGSLMGQIDTFLLMTVSLALAGRDRGDHQHDADEHDRAVRRVRRAADQRLVAGQHPGAGDARECLSRACSRAWSAACWRGRGALVANQFISGGIHLGMTPSLCGAGHRPVGRHGDAGRPLPRLAGRPAGPDGRDPARIALNRIECRHRTAVRMTELENRRRLQSRLTHATPT